MEILGIGTPELIAILIIMLIVAGPKRMIQWAYILGQYVAKFRSMWSDVMENVQKEFDAAGVDITVPKDIPTRQTFTNQMNKTWGEFTRPTQDMLNEVKAEIQDVKPLMPTAQKVEE